MLPTRSGRERALSPRYLAGAGALLLTIGLLATAPAGAQERGSASVSIDGTTVKLSTVTYKPTGDGPFPTLIFHHGSGNFDRPYDPRAVAQWFMARGWAVIAPSRRGRGGSEGVNEEGASCSETVSAEGADRALGDIDAMTPVLIAQPFVDRSRIAVAGQSRGGLLSVAWSGKHPELRAVVNFVGGWVDTRTCRHGRAINANLLEARRHLGTAVALALRRQGSLLSAGRHKGQFRRVPCGGWQGCVARIYAAGGRVERPSDPMGTGIMERPPRSLSRGTWPTIQARELAIGGEAQR